MPTVIDRRRVQELVQRGAQLVEVLGPKEYEAEHLPGAINIPLKALGQQATKLLVAVELQHALHLGDRRPLGRRRLPTAIEQAVIAEMLKWDGGPLTSPERGISFPAPPELSRCRPLNAGRSSCWLCFAERSSSPSSCS